MSHVESKSSCHIQEWVMSNIRISHVTHVNDSCHAHEWVMSLIWMSHTTRIGNNYELEYAKQVMSHMWRSHVTHTTESSRTHTWRTRRVMWHFWNGHGAHMKHTTLSHLFVTCLAHMCDGTLVWWDLLPNPLFTNSMTQWLIVIQWVIESSHMCARHVTNRRVPSRMYISDMQGISIIGKSPGTHMRKACH